MSDQKPRLEALLRAGYDVDIRPSPSERDWMDNSPKRFAYRCLPLSIANALGWEIRTPTGVSAVWLGGQAISDIHVRSDNPNWSPAVSHFGVGVLTFHVPALFRTEPGKMLYVTGPPNRPKHGIAALSAVIETGWSPYGFTMNWQFTAPKLEVRFEPGEPFCFVFVVDPTYNQNLHPEKRRLQDEPELEAQHLSSIQSRRNFLDGATRGEAEILEQKWQKDYFRGTSPDGTSAAEKHMTKVRLRPFGKIKGKVPTLTIRRRD